MTNSTPTSDKCDRSVDDLRSVAMAALERGSAVCVPASGVSMGETFSRAEGLYVRTLSQGRVKIGTILVYRNGAENWIAHRVIWLFHSNPRWFCVTKGDGFRSADVPFVQADRVIGEVVGLRYPDSVVQLGGFWAQRVQGMRGIYNLITAVVWETAHTLKRRRWRLRGMLNQTP